MHSILFTLGFALSLGVGQASQASRPLPQATRPLPMMVVEACQVEFTSPVDTSASAGKWGGRIALYKANTDDTGRIVSLVRQVIEGAEHLPPHVRLDQLEACVRRWRYEGQQNFTIALFGGPIFEGIWEIEVKEGTRAFRLRVPVARGNP